MVSRLLLFSFMILEGNVFSLSQAISFRFTCFLLGPSGSTGAPTHLSQAKPRFHSPTCAGLSQPSWIPGSIVLLQHLTCLPFSHACIVLGICYCLCNLKMNSPNLQEKQHCLTFPWLCDRRGCIHCPLFHLQMLRGGAAEHTIKVYWEYQ